jgi:hypothetical protein
VVERDVGWKVRMPVGKWIGKGEAGSGGCVLAAVDSMAPARPAHMTTQRAPIRWPGNLPRRAPFGLIRSSRTGGRKGVRGYGVRRGDDMAEMPVAQQELYRHSAKYVTTISFYP